MFAAGTPTLCRPLGTGVLGALLALAVASGAPAASASTHATHSRVRAARGCANADTPAQKASRRVMKVAVVCLVNEQRAAHGLPALSEVEPLDRAAQGWTDVMVSSGAFTHGADFAARITAVGIHWSAAGENIATGFGTVRAVVKAWMASLDHCRNILTPTYSLVGTGVSARPLASFGPATWTQDFALPIGPSRPSGNWAPSRGCPY
jgi:uncharacterized protein YkwD